MHKQYRSVSESSVYAELRRDAASLPQVSQLISKDRIQAYHLCSPHLSYCYSGARVTDTVLDLFQDATDELDLIGQYQRILAGEKMNFTENRSVQHHRTRSQTDAGWYGEELDRIAAFSKEVRLRYKRILHIGIGGSDLGPRAVYEALRRYASTTTDVLPIYFVSNLDPDDLLSVMSTMSFTDTLLILASKSGTTLETTMNWKLLVELAEHQGISVSDLEKSTVVVTSKGGVLDDHNRYLNIFYIDDAIGGRYSLTSAIGGVVLSCAFGDDIFKRFLVGAAHMDDHALNSKLSANVPLLNAWIGVWERQFLGLTAKAVVPYVHALSLVVSHLQQLDCESNGKSVDRYGDKINWPTGPVVWGGVGSISQHSFFQWLHQGANDSAIQLIGSRASQLPYLPSHTALNRNLAAQFTAFVCGDSHPDNLQKQCDGNRSTTLVMLETLSPESCGALISFYENTIMFQGFIWNINSFDQEAVQLGKQLAAQLGTTSPQTNPILSAIYDMISPSNSLI
jgi:glucose-6-phosphate isomerase